MPSISNHQGLNSIHHQLLEQNDRSDRKVSLCLQSMLLGGHKLSQSESTGNELPECFPSSTTALLLQSVVDTVVDCSEAATKDRTIEKANK